MDYKWLFVILPAAYKKQFSPKIYKYGPRGCILLIHKNRSATIWIQVGSLTSQSLHFGVFLSVDFTDITDPNKSKNINTENM